MKKDRDDKLKGHVDIDETLVGGYSAAIGKKHRNEECPYHYLKTLCVYST